MSSSSGSGGVQPQPSIPGLGASDLGGVSSGDVEAALKTPVKTLGELKALLVQKLGEKAGTKLYNTFITSFGMIMLQQMQDSMRRAQQAAENIRMNAP